MNDTDEAKKMDKIYIVEDDDNIRKLVCYALKKEGYSVKDFSRPSEFRKALPTEQPDLILLDIMLPEEDGLSILKSLRKTNEMLPIIMLTAKDSEYDKVTGLDMGADDYISKPFGMTELISRIKAVLRRTRQMNYQDKEEFNIGCLSVNIKKHTVFVDGSEVTLSFKEFSILSILLSANGNVVSREELFAKVWQDYYGESRTLDVHIRHLRAKLGKAGQYIQTVKNVGYKIGGDNIG